MRAPLSWCTAPPSIWKDAYSQARDQKEDQLLRQDIFTLNADVAKQVTEPADQLATECDDQVDDDEQRADTNNQ